MVLTAVWLRRKRALAYTMAGALLTFVTLLALAVMSLISAVVLAWHLRGSRAEREPGDAWSVSRNT